MKVRQIEANKTRGSEFEQSQGDADQHRPAPDAGPRPPLIMTEAKLFGFVKVNFDVKSTGISLDRSNGVEIKIGSEQIRGLELRQVRDDNDQGASRTRVPGLHAAHKRLVDRSRPSASRY